MDTLQDPSFNSNFQQSLAAEGEHPHTWHGCTPHSCGDAPMPLKHCRHMLCMTELYIDMTQAFGRARGGLEFLAACMSLEMVGRLRVTHPG